MLELILVQLWEECLCCGEVAGWHRMGPAQCLAWGAVASDGAEGSSLEVMLVVCPAGWHGGRVLSALGVLDTSCL